MPYLGKSPLHGNYQKLDDFSGDFDGSDATHALAQNSLSITPVTEAALIISINGVIQEPVTAYTVSGTNITFTSPPASGDTFFGVVLGEQLAIGTPSDTSVTPAKMNINSALLPASADGAALGSTAKEWSDLYLADGSVIYFGADQDVTVTHDPDDGLIVKSIATADDNPLVLTLQTGETTMVADEPIAQIHFQAPDEASGTDSILIAATIQATAETDFSASANPTSLDFLTGNSAAAGTDGGSMILGSTGNLTLKDLRTADGSSPTLTLQSGDTDMAANDILGKIAFQAPDEGAGTDAILVSAAIQARSEGDFSSSANATSLDFMLGASEAAATLMTLNSSGNLSVGDGTASLPSYSNTGDLNTGIYFPAADTVGVTAGGTEQFRFGSNPIPGGSKNSVINGNMLIDQRGSTAAIGASNGATYGGPDKFCVQVQSSPQGRGTATQDTTVLAGSGQSKSYKFDCTTAESAVAAGEDISIQHRFEGQNIQHWMYGQTNAVTLALSFDFRSPKSGTHCVAFYAMDDNEHYIAEFTVASADTFEHFEITVALKTTETDVVDDNTEGFRVVWPLVCGTTFQASAGAWANGERYATSNQQNLLDNTANNIYLSGVQLEVGSVATDFAHEDYGTTLNKCLRYFEKQNFVTNTFGAVGFSNTTTSHQMLLQFTEKRATGPTVAVSTATDWEVNRSGTDQTLTALAGSSASKVGMTLIATVSSGLTAGEAAVIRSNADTNYVTISSEL
jgi:hypothetical protein